MNLDHITLGREIEIIVNGREAQTWPCGHPKTDENTQSVGVAGMRCRICRRRIGKKYERLHRSKGGAA